MHIIIRHLSRSLEITVTSLTAIEYMQLISVCMGERHTASIRVAEVRCASLEEIRECLIANEIPPVWAGVLHGVVNR